MHDQGQESNAEAWMASAGSKFSTGKSAQQGFALWNISVLFWALSVFGVLVKTCETHNASTSIGKYNKIIQSLDFSYLKAEDTTWWRPQVVKKREQVV